MRGRGSDQGGRWPVGIWFALVGVSAGTVASFGMVGWTFAVELYDLEDAGAPLAIESESVVIEVQEPPSAPGAGDDFDLEPPVQPGSDPVEEPSPIEARVEEVRAEEAPPEERAPEEERAPVEESSPPQLVPADEPELECDHVDDAEDDPDRGWNGGWDGDTGWHWDEDRESNGKGRHGDWDWSDDRGEHRREERDHRRDADQRLAEVTARADAAARTYRG